MPEINEESDGYLYNGESIAPAFMLPIGVPQNHSNKITVLARISGAIKSLVNPQPDRIGIPYYQTMNDWDQTITKTLLNTANTTSNPRTSSLCFAGYRWLSNRLPEAVLRVMEPTADSDQGRPVLDHTFVDKWRRPNPYYSGRRS